MASTAKTAKGMSAITVAIVHFINRFQETAIVRRLTVPGETIARLPLRLSVGHRLFGGGFWSVSFSLSRLVITFVSIPLVLAYLGSERYGLWMTMLSILTITSFMDIGLTPTIKNRMAEALGKNDGRAFEFYCGVNLLVCLIILAIGLFISPIISVIDWAGFLHISDSSAKDEVIPLMYVIWFIGIGTIALSMVDSIYAVRFKMGKLKMLDILGSFVGFGLMLVAMSYHLSLPFIAFFYSGILVVNRLVLLVLFLIRRPAVIMQIRFPTSSNAAIKLIPSSVLFMGIQICAVALLALPNLLIARWLSLAEVTDFSLAYRVMSVPITLLAAILPVIWPAFTVSWIRGEKNRLYTNIKRSLLGSAILTVGFTVVVFFMRGLFESWTRGIASVPTMLIVALGIWLTVQVSVNWMSTFLHSISDFRFELVCFVATVLMFLLFSYMWTDRLQITGISLALAISLAIGSLIPMWIRLRTKWFRDKALFE